MLCVSVSFQVPYVLYSTYSPSHFFPSVAVFASSCHGILRRLNSWEIVFCDLAFNVSPSCWNPIRQLNKTIQNLVFTMLKDDSEIAAKKSLDIMVDLYRKRVWVVSLSAFVKQTKHLQLIRVAMYQIYTKNMCTACVWVGSLPCLLLSIV